MAFPKAVGGLRVPLRIGDPLSPACGNLPQPRGCLVPLWVVAFSGLSRVVFAVPPLTYSGLSVTLSYQQSGMDAQHPVLRKSLQQFSLQPAQAPSAGGWSGLPLRKPKLLFGNNI